MFNFKEKMIIKEIKPANNKRKVKAFAKQPEKTNDKGNISRFFGCNPKEEDGLNYQKKIRKEWD